jgi:hypothetical protein
LKIFYNFLFRSYKRLIERNKKKQSQKLLFSRSVFITFFTYENCDGILTLHRVVCIGVGYY